MNGPAGPDPTVHGGNGVQVAAALGMDPRSVLDLSASLCPVAPDPAAMVAGHLDALGRYPDPTGATEALAMSIGVEPGELLLTNGGAEAIKLVAAELGGTVVEPDFSLYPRHGGPRWRSNPNNPLGLLADATDTASVWDEAFWPLATGTWTRGDHRNGAIVIGSLTKLLACPGLRVGYVISGDVELMQRLRRGQPVWSVNGLVSAALPPWLAAVDLPSWYQRTAHLRAQLVDALASRGLKVRAGSAPWVLLDDAGDLVARLARAGVVVRDCASFGMPGTIRIAVPRPHQRVILERALDQALDWHRGDSTRPELDGA